MQSRMLRRFALAAVMLALPAGAFAQTSRVQGMALQGDYLKDYTGLFTYTSQVAEVGNLIYGELGNLSSPFGSPGDRSVGAVLGNLWDGEYGTFAVFLREETPNLGQGDNSSAANPGFLGGDPNDHANESFDIMWGRKMGTTTLGLRVNRSFLKAEGGLGYFDPAFGALTNLEFDFDGSLADANVRRNILGIGGGLGFELTPNTTAEVSVLWQTRTFEASDSLVPPGTRTEEDGSGTYQVAGRAMWQWQPNVVIVPVVKFYSYDLSTRTVSATSTTTDNTLRGWQAGASGNWTLGTNDLFILGVAFAQNRIEQEIPVVSLPASISPFDFSVTNGKITETIAPHVFAALETHVNNWLTLRFGANKGALHRIKAEDKVNDKTAKVSFSPFNMSLGAGVKLGALQLDGVLNDAFPQTLGGFFSNTPAGFVTFGKVTATYPF